MKVEFWIPKPKHAKRHPDKMGVSPKFQGLLPPSWE